MAHKIDLNKPRYDQSKYFGRAKHFLSITNPLNLLASDAKLKEAQTAVTSYKQTGNMPSGYDEEKLWAAKNLYDSAFHPDTGKKMLLVGRMSAQVPVNTLVTGFMIAFYNSNKAAIFWQWVNQSFNAIVNYTNRSGDASISVNRLAASYVCATGGAMGTALYLNSLTKSMSPIWGRLVPFAAVSGANCVNIPMMRSQEMTRGVPIFHPETKERICDSKTAATLGISLVVFSRIIMAIPSMTLTPIITQILVRRCFYEKYPLAYLPSQLIMVAMCLTFATPFACALFQQQAHIRTTFLESNVQEKIKAKYVKIPGTVVFNKGL